MFDTVIIRGTDLDDLTSKIRRKLRSLKPRYFSLSQHTNTDTKEPHVCVIYYCKHPIPINKDEEIADKGIL